MPLAHLKKRWLSDALWVLQFRNFRNVCFVDNERMSGAVLWELGKLMNEFRTNYDRSCAELDELTRICRDAGAYGSHLIGKCLAFLQRTKS
jgi:galactokinase